MLRVSLYSKLLGFPFFLLNELEQDDHPTGRLPRILLLPPTLWFFGLVTPWKIFFMFWKQTYLTCPQIPPLRFPYSEPTRRFWNRPLSFGSVWMGGPAILFPLRWIPCLCRRLFELPVCLEKFASRRLLKFRFRCVEAVLSAVIHVRCARRLT